jgi:YhcH/YjgK/YiaL family protein
MIIDQVTQLATYFPLHPLLPLVQDFVNQVDIINLPQGRHEISGDELFVTLAQVPGRSRVEAPLEAHRRYWDIHWLLAGEESFGWRPRVSCQQPRGAFDETKDIGFFDDEFESLFRLVPGQFALFMPQDAHAPLISTHEPGAQIHKLIFKLAAQSG